MSEITAADAFSTPKLDRTLVLLGMMGCGKSSVGGSLAMRLGVPFRDSDAEIVRRAGASVAEIFRREGEAGFRARERDTLAELSDLPPGVLSIGGGAFVDPRNRDLLARRTTTVWLDAGFETLWRRLRQGRVARPLLDTPDPRATLRELIAARRPAYARADIRVRCDRLSKRGAVDAVLAALAKRSPVS